MNIFFLFKKEFGLLTIEECKKIGLTHCHNIYLKNSSMKCKSVWRDKNFKSYRCKSYFIY